MAFQRYSYCDVIVFSIVYKTNGCKPAEAMAASIELVLLERANVVFGPYCSPGKCTYTHAFTHTIIICLFVGIYIYIYIYSPF